MKKIIFLLSFILVGIVGAQNYNIGTPQAIGAMPLGPQPPLRIESRGNGIADLKWHGVEGRNFLIQVSDDLESWVFVPVVEKGEGKEISYWVEEFPTGKTFARLITHDFHDDHYGPAIIGDFDGDGVDNYTELMSGTSPADSSEKPAPVTPGQVAQLEEYFLVVEARWVDTKTNEPRQSVDEYSLDVNFRVLAINGATVVNGQAVGWPLPMTMGPENAIITARLIAKNASSEPRILNLNTMDTTDGGENFDYEPTRFLIPSDETESNINSYPGVQLSSSSWRRLVPTDFGYQDPTPDSCSVSLALPSFLCVNDDDDQSPGQQSYEEWDYTHSPSLGDDDLKVAVVTVTTGENGGTLSLLLRAGGEKIGGVLWKDSEKKELFTERSWFVPPNSSVSKEFYLEGVAHSSLKNDVVIVAKLDCGESFDERTEMTTVYQVDLDVDSDNTDGFGAPGRTDFEDQIEYSEQRVPRFGKRPGKFLCVNNINDDGVPDWADGYDLNPNDERDNEVQGLRFTIAKLELKKPFDPQSATIKFLYKAGDPKDVSYPTSIVHFMTISLTIQKQKFAYGQDLEAHQEIKNP